LVTLNTPLDASPFTQPFPETHAHSHEDDHGHSHNGGHGHSHSGGGSHAHSGSLLSSKLNLIELNADSFGLDQSPIVASDSQIMKGWWYWTDEASERDRCCIPSDSGVYLHIMADALGSVGVIISTLCMRQFGWMIADPICSLCISTLIGLRLVSRVRQTLDQGVLLNVYSFAASFRSSKIQCTFLWCEPLGIWIIFFPAATKRQVC